MAVDDKGKRFETRASLLIVRLIERTCVTSHSVPEDIYHSTTGTLQSCAIGTVYTPLDG